MFTQNIVKGVKVCQNSCMMEISQVQYERIADCFPVHRGNVAYDNLSVNSTAQQGFGQAPQQGFDQQQNFNRQNFSQQGQPYNGTTQYGSNGAPVQPEHNLAIATLVLGIASIVFFFKRVSALLSIACGIAGVIISSKAKKAGNTEAIRQIGFVMSLVGVIVGAIIFVACVACTGAIGLGMLNY